jgi:antitoxin component of RelBE/YafQ-DinJ toxin-antitoxin module
MTNGQVAQEMGITIDELINHQLEQCLYTDTNNPIRNIEWAEVQQEKSETTSEGRLVH